MPIYKGTNEVTSGNLYKGSTEIENGYKATDPFYVNEISISFLNFPGVADYVITGAPGDTIPGNRYQQWTATAPSGSAYNGTQTATGLPPGFSFTGGSQGSTSNTTTSPRVNYVASVFPNNSTSVDYNTLTVSLPTSQVVTLSYTFTGGLGRSTSCTTFSGSSCGVSSNSQFAGNFEYWNSSASGTGGYGANSCNQGCSVSISSSGGSSSCDTSGGRSSQSAALSMVAVPTYCSNNPTGWKSVIYCATVNTGSASSICGGYSISMKRPSQPAFSGGYGAESSCGSAPSCEITPPSMNGYRLVGRDLNGTESGTWQGKITNGSGQIEVSASAST
jgi:hypothetical protein